MLKTGRHLLFAGLWAFILTSFALARTPSDCVLIHFTADWCQPCRAVHDALQQLGSEGWIVRQADVDREKGLAQRWKVAELPTVIVLENGSEVDRITGEQSIESLRARVSNDFKIHSDAGVNHRVPEDPHPRPLSHKNGRGEAVGQLQASGRGGAVDPMQVSVRIRIEDGNSLSFGTGTIIDQHQQEALVLTCGHLFRDLSAASRVTVEVPLNGRLEACPASVVDYQFQTADIGLVSFRTSQTLPVAPLLARGVALREGDKVCSVGCDHGADPSRRDSQITKLNRYLGAPNVEVAKAPVQGRSGGGLFNERGELIGVCYAAEPTLDEGLYSAPEVVYTQLNRLGLSRLYDRAASSNPLALSNVSRDATPLARSYGRGAGGEGLENSRSEANSLASAAQSPSSAQGFHNSSTETSGNPQYNKLPPRRP